MYSRHKNVNINENCQQCDLVSKGIPNDHKNLYANIVLQRFKSIQSYYNLAMVWKIFIKYMHK